MTDNFLKAIDNVLIHEGGYVNDPKDPGGETNFGISKRSYPTLNIKTLSKDQAISIYYKDFWLPIHGDDMPPFLAINVLDLAVNAGVKTAIKTLQNALGTTQDGQMGSNTISLVKTATHQNMFDFVRLRMTYYASLKNFSTYYKSWINRTFDTLYKSC